MILQHAPAAEFSATPHALVAAKAGHSKQNQSPFSIQRRRRRAVGRGNAPRGIRYGHTGWRREGLSSIPETDEEEEDNEIDDEQTVINDTSLAQDSLSTATTVRPPESPMTQSPRRGPMSSPKQSTMDYEYTPLRKPSCPPRQSQQEEHCPVDLRWETPKSTIQLEDLLFGIGSQFDDMPFSPRQLSYIHATHIHGNKGSYAAITTPSDEAATKDKYCDTRAEYENDCAYEHGETTLLLSKQEDSTPLPWLHRKLSVTATATSSRSRLGLYLGQLSGALSSAMRRLMKRVWDVMGLKACGGLCVRSSCQRRQRKRIYLT